MSMPRATNIEDLRQLAARRLPRVLRDFLEGGAEEHLSLRANGAALGRILFSPRTLVDVSHRSQSVEIFGQRFASPFGIAPTGASGLFWHEAETALARAAGQANVPCILSTHSFMPYERVARNAACPPWFQLYMSPERDRVGEILRRVRGGGCEVLVLTSDVPVGGNREYNERNGFGMPFRLSARNAFDGLRHPRWLAGVFLRSHSAIRAASPAEWNTRRDALDWREFAWLRGQWPGKLLVKGILCAEDARRAAGHGADGIVVSNHGGRQLDGAPAPIEVLPEIVATVGDQLHVMVDGGFRRGADIVKALALGADLVLVGRPALYGLAAGGEAGVRHALEILRSEVDRVQALLGCPALGELDARFLRLPPGMADAAATARGHAAAALRLAGATGP